MQTDQDQEQMVVTGLEAMELTAQTVNADGPVVSNPAEPVIERSAPTADVPAGRSVSAEPSKELYLEATDDNAKRNFVEQVFAARNPEVKPYVAPPIPPRIAEQTRLEMEAGRRRVADFEAQQASRPQRPVEPDGTTTAVFRPADYVPDQQKNQGHVGARPLS